MNWNIISVTTLQKTDLDVGIILRYTEVRNHRDHFNPTFMLGREGIEIQLNDLSFEEYVNIKRKYIDLGFRYNIC